jgi:hypothetical protein
MAAGALFLAMAPVRFGIAGYVVPIVIVTAGYALFQAANNTATMARIGPQQRGVGAGLLSLSRNLGLITGASAMGAVFAAASGIGAVAHGLRFTFAVAAALIAGAIAAILAAQAHRSLRRIAV